MLIHVGGNQSNSEGKRVKPFSRTSYFCWFSTRKGSLVNVMMDSYTNVYTFKDLLSLMLLYLSLYAYFLPPGFLTKKHVNLSNFPDTPRLFFCAGSRERLVI